MVLHSRAACFPLHLVQSINRSKGLCDGKLNRLNYTLGHIQETITFCLGWHDG